MGVSLWLGNLFTELCDVGKGFSSSEARLLLLGSPISRVVYLCACLCTSSQVK